MFFNFEVIEALFNNHYFIIYLFIYLFIYFLQHFSGTHVRTCAGSYAPCILFLSLHDSLTVTHPTTNPAKPGLTLLIR